MRKSVFIVALVLSSFVYSQNIESEDLVGQHFYVKEFDSDQPLSFEKNDSVTLKNGLDFEGFYFNKNER